MKKTGRNVVISGTDGFMKITDDYNVAVTQIGVLDNVYGVTSGVGIGIGKYASEQPNMVYDATQGNMIFNIHNVPYMGLEYNEGAPRMWIGSGINTVEVTGDGLDVGISIRTYDWTHTDRRRYTKANAPFRKEIVHFSGAGIVV